MAGGLLPPCLGILEQKDYLPPKDFHGTSDYWEVRKEEMITLAMAPQRCMVQSEILQGVLWSSAEALPVSCPPP